MTNAEAFICLNMAADIGSAKVAALLSCFASPAEIFRAAPGTLTQAGLSEKAAHSIATFDPQLLRDELARAKALGLEIVTPEDSGYPERLKNIPDPPVALYIKGTLVPADECALALVGSRQASFYGINCARRFAIDLASVGVTVVSGMARGIDTAAHRGALDCGGRTIAVLGSGFGCVYPPENRQLAEEISVRGAVISEFPISEKPLKYNFPRRNRIISGLSRGVLVVEAARNSGAMITVDCALEQGRDVFAVPGSIDAAGSLGANELIKQGACMVTDISDILNELDLSVSSPLPSSVLEAHEAMPVMAEDEEKVCGVLTAEPVSIDEIAGKTALDIPRISAILLQLQLKNIAAGKPGKQFVRSMHG